MKDTERCIELELLHNRFNSISQIKEKINSAIGFDSKVESLFVSESETFEEQDNLIDGEVKIKGKIYLLEVWYLLDNAGKFYITEINLQTA